MIMSPDPHAVLGIAPGASLIEIRAAYASILDSLKLGRVAAGEAETRLVAARAAFKKLTENSPSSKVVLPHNTLSDNKETLQGESPASIASIKFTGQAWEFFRIWIVNVCLSVVTLGIYSAWAKVRRKRYFYGNTLLNDNAFEYLADPKSILKGRLIMLSVIVLVGLANRFLKIKIFGLVYLILLPYIIVKAARFNAANSSYRNVRFTFGNNFPLPTGRFRRYIPGYREASQFLILPIFLVPLSLGLLYPYYAYRKRQFMLQHSCYGTSMFGFDAKASHFYLAYFKAAMMFLICMLGGILTIGIGILPLYILFASYRDATIGRLAWQHTTLGSMRFDYKWRTWDLFKLNLSNTFAILISFGLLVPWAEIRTARYQLQGLALAPAEELGSFVAADKEQVGATGDEAADFLGFDFGL
jgi:uncharacterized membrane protein YjgN (DUF898 family)